MPVNMNTFWSDLGVVGGVSGATNQYDLFNGLIFSDGYVTSSQYDFFTHLGTNSYEFFKSYNSVDPNIVDQYTFFQNTSDPNIYNFNTFYTYAGEFINSEPVTPTPTPTQTTTPTVTPTRTVTPTPSVTTTLTPTSSVTPTPTLTPTPSGILPTSTYITNRTDGVARTSYSFNGTSIGGPGLIIVGCSYTNSSSSSSIGSLTIGGVSATKINQVVADNSTKASATLFALRVTAGTTADIAVNISGPTVRNMGISVFRVQNNNSDTITVSGTGSQTYGASVSTTLTSILTNSVIIAINTSRDYTGSVQPTNWTNVTERYDNIIIGNDYMSGGDTTSSDGGSLTITATALQDQAMALCALAIR